MLAEREYASLLLGCLMSRCSGANFTVIYSPTTTCLKLKHGLPWYPGPKRKGRWRVFLYNYFREVWNPIAVPRSALQPPLTLFAAA
eukprot:6209534-Pleurochrysis_carterae.AAC.3